MCGFVGMVGNASVAPVMLLGLQAIQHRGQDAAGIGTRDDGRFHLLKDLGLITTAIPAAVVPNLTGTAGIAHVRYPTAGASSTREDAQPFLTRRPGVLLAHNGNVTNVPQLSAELREEGFHVLSQCDAEPILLVFTEALLRRRPSAHTAEDVASAVRAVHDRVRGAYSVVAVMHVDGRETLVAFRDPHGIRPGVFGTDGRGTWMAASESVALDVVGFRKVGDIPPGQAMLLRHGDEPVFLPVTEGVARHCVFERIYFARPDSVMEDGRINRLRWLMGRQLAREWSAKGFEADVVVAVPDTSRPTAMAMADELGVKNREGFIKNRYSGRTFIMPDQATRQATLRLKLNPVREIFEGQRVVMVDDSIVRGTTMQRIVAMVRELNPAALHIAVSSPPVRNACYYGIDMPSEHELVAAQLDPRTLESSLCRQLGADSLTYLSIDGLRDVVGEHICDACFTGDYPVPVSEAERTAISAERRG